MIKVCLVDNDCNSIMSVKRMMDEYFADFSVSYEIDMMDSTALIAPKVWTECGYDLAVFNISDRADRTRLLEYSVEIRKLCRKTKVILLSEELNSVLDTFEYDPDYFIHRPQADTRLAAAMEHLLKLDANKGAGGLVLSTKQAKHIIPQRNIMYIEHYQHKSKIICEDRSYTCSEKLSTLLERLDGAMFMRCHCSFIVNLEYVRKATRTQLFMRNGDILPCSRSNQLAIREALENSRKVKT